MGGILQISWPPIVMGLSSPSVRVPGIGDCSRCLEKRSCISCDQVYCVGMGGCGSWNSNARRPEIDPACTHCHCTVWGRPSPRYLVVGQQDFIWHVWRLLQPIDPIRQPFVLVWPPSTPVRVSVWLSVGVGSRGVFEAETGFESPPLHNPGQ